MIQNSLNNSVEVDKINYNQDNSKKNDKLFRNDLKVEKNEAYDIDINFFTPTLHNCNQFDKPKSLSGKGILQTLN